MSHVGKPFTLPPRRMSGIQDAGSRVGKFVRRLWSTPGAARLGWLVLGLFVVIVATVVGQIRLNAWNQPFYDALAQKDLAVFAQQTLVFLYIAGGLLVLNVAQNWLHETVRVRLRELLTHSLLDDWLGPRRAVHLALAGEIGVNPDQRIHEDTRHLSELSADLGIGLLQAALLLVSFVGVLWILSRDVAFVMGDQTIAIPGYMVWCALIYAATGSWLSWRVGRPLVALNAERYTREAELRFTLVRVNEHLDAISLHAGEGTEHKQLREELDRVIGVLQSIVRMTARLTWVTAGYGWFAIIAPVLVAAPGYFGGSLSFGKLMMAVAAFLQVQQALRWFIDNYGRIADWHATFLRIKAFRDALAALDVVGEGFDRIAIEDHPEGGLAFDRLELTSAAGCSVLDEVVIDVPAGTRLLIVGNPGSGKSALFRAMAGLWPWGRGRLRLPPRESMMFLPQRPYLPLGSLREALLYPVPSRQHDEQALCAALHRVSLAHLTASLDQTRRWDRELTLDEQQRFAFARLLLHEPRWVIMDEAIDTIDEENRRLVLSIFEKELAATGVVSIGHRAALNGFYDRLVHLALHSAPCLWPSRVEARRIGPAAAMVARNALDAP